MAAILIEREIRHAHFFCGLGGGARGFNRGHARVGNLIARFRCLGGIDVDRAAIRDFERLAGVKGTVMDLFDLEQYIAFHGHAPPPGWHQAMPDDVRAAMGYEFPDIVFLSAPCKGFSGLLGEKQSKTAKYQALNALTVRGVFLMLEAWKDDPPALIIFENVPRIATRGEHLLRQIEALFRAYGYVISMTTHNCGEIGELSQSRERFLLVARYPAKVPNFLYEPPKRPLRGVGEVLDRLPLPGDLDRGGPMHRVPALQFQTWVRLAFVPAGKDWRALNSLRVEDGVLKDFALAPVEPWQAGVLGVRAWDEPTGVVAGRSTPTNGAFSVADPRSQLRGAGQGGVSTWDQPAPTITSARSPLQNRGAIADPRIDGHPKSVQLGVRPWDQPAPTIKGDVSVGGGPYAVADPRPKGKPRFNNVFRIVPASEPSPAVAGPGGPAGGLCVADPRGAENRHVNGKYRITAYDEPSSTIIAGSTTGNGAFAFADPRVSDRRNGQLGVLPFDEPSGVIAGESLPPNGTYAVADPRGPGGADEQHGKYPVTAYDEAARAVIGGRDNGAFSVADPRMGEQGYNKTKYQVTPYDASSRAVIGASTAGDGAFAVADPRTTHSPRAHTNKHKVVDYDGPAPTVTGSDRVGSGALSVADPRHTGLARPDHYGVLKWEEPSGTVTGSSHGWDNGRFSVADPRPAGLQGKDANSYGNQAHYGVVPWEAPSGSVTAHGQFDNGRWSVADKRVDILPGLKEQLVCQIIALDGTWHRPFTTLELAALQSLYDPEDKFELDGKSDSAWRERIGNAVPSAAAKAIADVMGETLLRAEAGETFTLSSNSIWVRQMQIALSVDTSGQVPA